MNIKDIESLVSQLDQWKNFNSAALFSIKKLCNLNKWPYGELWCSDVNHEHMVWAGFWSDNNNYFESFSKFSSMHKFAIGVGLIGNVWQSRNLLSIEDISKTKMFLRSSVAAKSGLNSAICIPILNNNIVICLLCFFLKKITPIDINNANLFFSKSYPIGKILANI